MTKRFAGLSLALLSAGALLALGGCALGPKPDAVEAPPPPAVTAPVSAAQAASEPAAPVLTASTVLAQGLKAYQSGQYQQAELDLKSALQMGLSAPDEVAQANKYLAFIYCTSKREAQCLAAFKAARAADSKFALSKSEAGHPMWGPVYKRSLGKKK